MSLLLKELYKLKKGCNDMVKALTYEELIEYALKHYNKGGDTTYECLDEKAFDEYVKLFGPITKRKALEMFKLDYEIQKDRAGWY